MGKRLQVQTGANGCCGTPDECNLFASGGSYDDVEGTWASGSYSGYTYYGTSDPDALTEWNDASTFGDRYAWCGMVNIENEGDVAIFYFSYNLADGSYGGRIEIRAGDPSDGSGGQVKLYVGGSLITTVDADVRAGSYFTVGVCIGAALVAPQECGGDSFVSIDTTNIVYVSSGWHPGDSTCFTESRYGWATYTLTTAHRSYALGTGASNTGYVRWIANYWIKNAILSDFPLGESETYDCYHCDEYCGFCKDASKKVFCTVTFDTPDGITNTIPNAAEQYIDQSFELEIAVIIGSPCDWRIADWVDDIYFDGPEGPGTVPVPATFSLEVRFACCDGEVYLVVSLEFISGAVCGTDHYYYHLADWDYDCAIGEIELNDGNTVDEVVGFPTYECPGGNPPSCGPFTTSPTKQFTLGGNTITLNFHN